MMCFEQLLNKAKKTTDYILPTEVCVMINVIFDAKNQVRYDIKKWPDQLQCPTNFCIYFMHVSQ